MNEKNFKNIYFIAPENSIGSVFVSTESGKIQRHFALTPLLINDKPVFRLVLDNKYIKYTLDSEYLNIPGTILNNPEIENLAIRVHSKYLKETDSFMDSGVLFALDLPKGSYDLLQTKIVNIRESSHYSDPAMETELSMVILDDEGCLVLFDEELITNCAENDEQKEMKNRILKDEPESYVFSASVEDDIGLTDITLYWLPLPKEPGIGGMRETCSFDYDGETISLKDGDGKLAKFGDMDYCVCCVDSLHNSFSTVPAEPNNPSCIEICQEQNLKEITAAPNLRSSVDPCPTGKIQAPVDEPIPVEGTECYPDGPSAAFGSVDEKTRQYVITNQQCCLITDKSRPNHNYCVCECESNWMHIRSNHQCTCQDYICTSTES
jgi:hypothetical protein